MLRLLTCVSDVRASRRQNTTASTPEISLSPFSHLEGKLLYSCFFQSKWCPCGRSRIRNITIPLVINRFRLPFIFVGHPIWTAGDKRRAKIRRPPDLLQSRAQTEAPPTAAAGRRPSRGGTAFWPTAVRYSTEHLTNFAKLKPKTFFFVWLEYLLTLAFDIPLLA